MMEPDSLAQRFQENRSHLRAVAYRMLGSLNEADDAVQETWLRLSRSDAEGIDNLAAWLTTVVSRVCLDMLRSRRSRREELAGAQMPETSTGSGEADPEEEAVLADSVGPALLVVLDTLSPAERLAFVLHDMFAVSFDEIAAITDRSPVAARQLASRARRRVQGTHSTPDANRDRQRTVVAAFVAASRRGDFDALLELLDPDVLLRADAAAVRRKAPVEARGAARVVQQAIAYSGRAPFSHLALVDGQVGVVVAPRGRLVVVLALKTEKDRIIEIDVIGDPDRLAKLDLAVVDDAKEDVDLTGTGQ